MLVLIFGGTMKKKKTSREADIQKKKIGLKTVILISGLTIFF